MRNMRAERERLNAKIVAENLRLGAEARELTSEEELCYLILVSGGSCNVQWDGQTTLAAPGCALLLGPGSGRLQQAGQCAAGAAGVPLPGGCPPRYLEYGPAGLQRPV